MNIYVTLAGILCVLLGLVHSFLGEYLIFKDKRESGNIVPTKTNSAFKERHLRILWATWHLCSFFGWCVAAFLIKIGLDQDTLDAEFVAFAVFTTSILMFLSSVLVLVGTKGKHPGWMILLIIGVLLLIGN